MHIYRTLAALALVQSFSFITAAPLTAPPIPSIVITDTEPQRSSNQALALTPSSPNGDSSAPRQPSSFGSPSKVNTTLISPQGMIPYRVTGSSTTLLFHGFGDEFPSPALLQALSFSLTLVLAVTLDGKGRDLITYGFFRNTHIMANGDNVTINVADFRESGKPMTYYNLRDVLSGIGDFMTEPEQEVTTLSFEVDVDEIGYVGTGHVGFMPGGK